MLGCTKLNALWIEKYGDDGVSDQSETIWTWSQGRLLVVRTAECFRPAAAAWHYDDDCEGVPCLDLVSYAVKVASEKRQKSYNVGIPERRSCSSEPEFQLIIEQDSTVQNDEFMEWLSTLKSTAKQGGSRGSLCERRPAWLPNQISTCTYFSLCIFRSQA